MLLSAQAARMNSDLMAQIHAKALKASLAEAACSSDAGTSSGTPLLSEAPENDEAAVIDPAPVAKSELAGLANWCRSRSLCRS